MATRWVSNSSPLILLGRAGAAELLWRTCDELIVPQSVALEIQAHGVSDPAQRLLEEGSVTVVPDAPVSLDVARWDLGSGESAVLSYAVLHRGWIAVLDDGLARRAAAALGVEHIGTVGVVLRAKVLGIVPEVRSILSALKAHGARLDERVIEDALRIAGEEK